MKKVVLFLAIVSFSSVAGITDITTKPVALIALKKNSAQYVDVCKAADDSCKWSTNYSGGARGRIRKFHDDK